MTTQGRREISETIADMSEIEFARFKVRYNELIEDGNTADESLRRAAHDVRLLSWIEDRKQA